MVHAEDNLHHRSSVHAEDNLHHRSSVHAQDNLHHRSSVHAEVYIGLKRATPPLRCFSPTSRPSLGAPLHDAVKVKMT